MRRSSMPNMTKNAKISDRQKKSISDPALATESEDANHTSASSSSAMQASGVRSTRFTQSSLAHQERSFRSQGKTLRGKFLLTFMSVSGLSIILLGIAVIWISNVLLFSQVKYNGIVIAKQLASESQTFIELRPKMRLNMENKEIEASFLATLKRARFWGEQEETNILGFQISAPGDILHGVSDGPTVETAQYITPVKTLLVPGRGWISLPADISCFSLQVTDTSDPAKPQQVDAFRFKVLLPNPKGDPNNPDSMYLNPKTHYISLDMKIGHVYWSRNIIILIVSSILILALIIVFVVAIRMADNITKPVQVLLKDIDIIAQGNLAHETRAASNDEIGLLAAAFNSMTTDLRHITTSLVDQESKAKLQQYEMETAREVQHQLLPAEKPVLQGYEIESFYQGAKAVSGDYYDFIDLGNGMVGFIVADVSGKGIPGSMVMAVMRTIVRLIAAQNSAGAAETLKRTNRLIGRQIKRGMFITAFYAVLNTKTNTLTFASAGHPPMCIYRAGRRIVELAGPKGIAIGFDPAGPTFDKQMEEYEITLGAGDSFALYTDGFTEAMSPTKEEYGEQRFYQTFADAGTKPAKDIVLSILESVNGHRNGAEQSDDLTLLVVRRGV